MVGQRFVARADAGSLTQSIIHANVPAGTYYVLVKSFGDYGDVGQYTVSVSTGSVLTQKSATLAASSVSTLQTTSGAPTKAVVDTPSSFAKSSSLLGAGPNTMLADATTAITASVPIPNAKKAKGTNTAELHDLVFELGGLEDEWAVLKRFGRS